MLTAEILCCLGSQVKMSGDIPLNINIKEPRWDQGTFMGRAQHFFMVTDPRNVLLSSAVLEDARVIVENYRSAWQRGETYFTCKATAFKCAELTNVCQHWIERWLHLIIVSLLEVFFCHLYSYSY